MKQGEENQSGTQEAELRGVPSSDLLEWISGREQILKDQYGFWTCAQMRSIIAGRLVELEELRRYVTLSNFSSNTKGDSQ